MKQAAATIVSSLASFLFSCSIVEAFVSTSSSLHSSKFLPNSNSASSVCSSRARPLNLWLTGDPTSGLNHALTQASNHLATIDSDIDSIPTDEFGKVFAGGGLIILGSVLSVVFVGFLLELGGGGYADLVAETYAEQNYDDDGESFFESLKLSPDQKKETEEMVRAFREKKMKKAGTWTEQDEKKKQQLAEEKDMFSDYD